MPYTKAYRTEWTQTPPAALGKQRSRSPSPDLLTHRRNWQRRFALGEKFPEKQPIQFAVHQALHGQGVNPGFTEHFSKLPSSAPRIDTNSDRALTLEEFANTVTGWSSDEEKAEDLPVDLAPYGIIVQDFAHPQPQSRQRPHDAAAKKPTGTATTATSSVVGHLRDQKERSPLPLASRPLGAPASTAGETSTALTVPLNKSKQPEPSVAPTARPVRYTRIYPSHWTLPTPPPSPVPMPLPVVGKPPFLPTDSTLTPPHPQFSSPKHFYPPTLSRPGAKSSRNDDEVSSRRPNARLSTGSSQYSTIGIASRQNSYTTQLSGSSEQYSTVGMQSRRGSFRDGQGEAQRTKRASHAYSTYDDADW